MGSLTRFNLKQLVQQNVTTLYETGTGTGKAVSTRYAIDSGFTKVYTCESYEPLFQQNQKEFGHIPGLVMSLEDSDVFLRAVPKSSSASRVFFLDAHFYGGVDFGGSPQSYVTSADHPKSFPLEDELDILLSKDIQNDWIIIDDARLYVEGSFGEGACPDWAAQFARMEALRTRLTKLEATHHVHLSRQDHGYWVIGPRSQNIHPREIVRVLSTDLAGDLPGQVPLELNVPGVTSISIARRLADHRFATRYFKGRGLDIGPGNDTLALFREFFPLIQNITTYDFPQQGDAQHLVNVDDGTFDFVYSSHCLEHLRDPVQALRNWIRVVKPGGYLVVQVPDEDLYEQGQWPSRYNSDHKLTFTIKKAKSWSPVSVNVLDLLAGFAEQVNVLQVGLQDGGYRYGLAHLKFDQTRTPFAESGIEFILQKHPHAPNP